MTKKKKITVEFSRLQVEFLDETKNRLGMSYADIVRECVNDAIMAKKQGKNKIEEYINNHLDS